MEAATLTTVLLVSLYRTPASLARAAWETALHPLRYRHRAGAVRHVLLFFAAEKLLGATGGALLWTELNGVKRRSGRPCCRSRSCSCSSATERRSALFRCTTGCRMRAWGPTPVSAVLSGLLLNVALYAVVRCKVLVEGAVPTAFARNLMMGFGLLSVVAAFLLTRQKDVKRLFAYSSIEHMGIITFAFGMGGPIASFAGLLHMTVHSLTKSAIFFAVGHAAQKAGTQLMDDIRGLVVQDPMIGWGMALGTLAILGMPPFGVFASEFRSARRCAISRGRRRSCWLPLASRSQRCSSRVQPMVFGETSVKRLPHRRDDPGVRASRAGADAGVMDSTRARGLVPRSRAAHRMRTAMNLSPLGLAFAQLASNLPAVRTDTGAGLVLACAAAADPVRGSWRCGPPTIAIAAAASTCMCY